jgi:hypothetical protein
MAIGKTRMDKMLNNGEFVNGVSAWLWAMDTETINEILSMIKIDQLLTKGVNKDGEIIGLYSEATQAINPEKVAGTPYTLFDTGDFYRSMFISVFNERIEINADPVKSPEDNLFELYGTGIIGLTEENKTKLVEIIKKKYIEYYRKTLFGGI